VDPDADPEINIMIMQSDAKQIVVNERFLTRGSKISALTDYLARVEGLQDLNAYRLRYGKHVINPATDGHKKLLELGVGEEQIEVQFHFVAWFPGGSKSVAPDLEADSRVDLVLDSDTQCMVYLVGGADFARVRMKCGHVISRDGLYYLVENQLTKGYTDIKCCNKSCKAAWNWELCCFIARIKGDEKKAKEKRILQNIQAKDPSQKPCPKCLRFVKRESTGSNLRVLCTNSKCAAHAFCWQCFREWKGVGTMNCGNPNCGYDLLNQKLADCPRQTIGSVPNVPRIRACPKCPTPVLIQHGEACKHMRCVQCTSRFCHVCLSIYDPKSGWSCGGSSDACPLAPVQKF
jgi:hypothetical protein